MNITTVRLNELIEAASEMLLPHLCDVAASKFCCRFCRHPGSIAFWDNRAVHHFASPDFDGTRVMHRVVIDGGPVF